MGLAAAAAQDIPAGTAPVPAAARQTPPMRMAQQQQRPGRQPAAPPAAAPSAPPPAAAPSAPPPAAAPSAANAEPAAAPPAATAPLVPSRTEILNFENWAVTCNEFADGAHPRRCSALLQVMQQNTNQNTNQVVFTWSVGMDDRKQMIAVMQTPTGVVIAPGVELKIGKVTQKIPFTSCDSGRCIVSTLVDANLLREMTTSPTAEVVIQGPQGAVRFNIQMKGFDRANAVLTK